MQVNVADVFCIRYTTSMAINVLVHVCVGLSPFGNSTKIYDNKRQNIFRNFQFLFRSIRFRSSQSLHRIFFLLSTHTVLARIHKITYDTLSWNKLKNTGKFLKCNYKILCICGFLFCFRSIMCWILKSVVSLIISNRERLETQ